MGNLQIKKALQTVFASKKAKIVAAFGLVVVVVAALVVGNGGSFRGSFDIFPDIREDLSGQVESFQQVIQQHKAFNLRKFDVFNPIFLAEAENQDSLVDRAVDPVKVKDDILPVFDSSSQFVKGFKIVIGSNQVFDSIDYANDLTVNQFNFVKSSLLSELELVDFAKEFERTYIKNYEIDALPTSNYPEPNNGKTTLLTSVVEFPFLGANMLQFDGTFSDEAKTYDIKRTNVARNAFEVSKNKAVGVKLDQRFIDQRPMLPSLSYVSGNQCSVRYRQPSLQGVESRYFQWVPFGTLPLEDQDFNHVTGEFRFVANQDLTSSYNYLVYRLSRIPYQKVETCSYNGNQEKNIESGFYYLVDQAGVVRIKTKGQPSASLVTGDFSRPNLVYYTDAEQNADGQTDDYLRVLYQGNNIVQSSTLEVETGTVNLKLETASSKGLSAVSSTFGNKNVLYKVYAANESDDKLHQFIKIENVTSVAKDFFILVADDAGKSKTLGFKIKLKNSTLPDRPETPETPSTPSTPANPQNPDSDGDGVVNERDNCPTIPNPDQRNRDGAADGGDVCDEDNDNDGVLDALGSPSPTPQNPDSDGDGVVNERDNCPAVYNLGQTNSDNDALGDACDQDDDNDTVLDALDNCPTVANTDQADSDRDLVGNVCEGLVAETVNPIDLTFVPATPNIFKVDTKAPSNRVVVNLYNATTDSPIYTVDFYLSEGTTATTLLAVGQYNCVLLLGCNGFNGEVQNFTLPLNVPLYYKASIKLADGFTYSDRSENFVFTTLPTTPGQGVGGQEFTDVNQFDPNYVAVKYVAELGLMRGSNGLFRPYDQLTRAESFAISNRLSGANRGCQAYNPQFDGNLGFVDLFASINAPETYWYMTEIKCSRALGIVRGYADGTVKPLNAVNEAESVKVLLSAAAAGRALRATLPLVQGLENPWWLPYYEFLNRNGLNFPVNNGGQIITRGQFAQLVYALGNRGLIDANVIRSNLGLPPLSTTGTAGSSTTSGSGFNNSIVLPPAN